MREIAEISAGDLMSNPAVGDDARDVDRGADPADDELDYS
jgi:hypothetical protein